MIGGPGVRESIVDGIVRNHGRIVGLLVRLERGPPTVEQAVAGFELLQDVMADNARRERVLAFLSTRPVRE